MINWPKNPNVGDTHTHTNGAKWRWNGKGWLSLKSTFNTVTYQFSHGPVDPFDNTSYYIGNLPDFPPQSNPINSTRIKSLVTGKIKSVSILTEVLSDLGSNEGQTFSIKNWTKDVTVTITSDFKHTSISQINNYEILFEIEKGDEIGVIWTVPTFSISPKLVRHNFNFYVEF